MAQPRGTCGKHLSHCGCEEKWQSVTACPQPGPLAATTWAAQEGVRASTQHSSTMDRCYNCLSLPLPAILPGKNRLLWGLNHKERFLTFLSYRAQHGKDTKSLVHHATLAPLPAGPKISPWDTELTCCGKRVLKTELQSQDAEQQAWNGVGMTESTTPAICFTHSPESLPSSTGSSSLKQISRDIPPPSQSPR